MQIIATNDLRATDLPIRLSEREPFQDRPAHSPDAPAVVNARTNASPEQEVIGVVIHQMLTGETQIDLVTLQLQYPAPETSRDHVDVKA